MATEVLMTTHLLRPQALVGSLVLAGVVFSATVGSAAEMRVPAAPAPSTPVVAPAAPRPTPSAPAVPAAPPKAPAVPPAPDLDPSEPAGAPSVVPASLNLFRNGGFRYQDPNYYACTATSVMIMLNLVRLGELGGAGFRWNLTTSSATRDSILAWERAHHTMQGGHGSDPHGWRNALNYYGWGAATLDAAKRIYEDRAYTSYEVAIKSLVRAIIRYRKPVGIAAWRGRHAQLITGFDGLKGDPFAKDAAGYYTNDFTVAALYLTDPLRSQGIVNKRITYNELQRSQDAKIRFDRYGETDSPYDDPYTPGVKPSRDEWYGRFVILAPVR
jgi:hypothetical protein